MMHPTTLLRSRASAMSASLEDVVADNLARLNQLEELEALDLDLGTFEAARRTARVMRDRAIKLHNAAAVMHTAASMVLEMPPDELASLADRLRADEELHWLV